MKFPLDFSPPKEVKIYPQKTVINWYFNETYHIYALPDIEHKLEDAKMQIDLMKQLFGNEKVNIILDLRDSHSLAYEARKYYSTEEGLQNTIYTAILVNSAFNKALGNFMMGVFKSSLKSKLFLSVEDAVEWLKIEK